MRQVALDFDLTETAVRQWVVRAERDAGTRADGLSPHHRVSTSVAGSAGRSQGWRRSAKGKIRGPACAIVEVQHPSEVILPSFG